ncbi:hypothetical protein VTI74DRAFT_3660 [Chaetomium olivicolor]
MQWILNTARSYLHRVLSVQPTPSALGPNRHHGLPASHLPFSAAQGINTFINLTASKCGETDRVSPLPGASGPAGRRTRKRRKVSYGEGEGKENIAALGTGSCLPTGRRLQPHFPTLPASRPSAASMPVLDPAGEAEPDTISSDEEPLVASAGCKRTHDKATAKLNIP